MELCIEKESLDLGDGLTVDIELLNVPDYQKALAFFSGVASENVDVDNLDEQAMVSLVSQMKKPELGILIEALLPKYCSNLQGLSICESVKPKKTRPGTIDDLKNYGAFLNTCVQILTALLSRSVVSAEEAQEIKK